MDVDYCFPVTVRLGDIPEAITFHDDCTEILKCNKKLQLIPNNIQCFPNHINQKVVVKTKETKLIKFENKKVLYKLT